VSQRHLGDLAGQVCPFGRPVLGEIELVPAGTDHFAGAGGGQDQEFERACGDPFLLVQTGKPRSSPSDRDNLTGIRFRARAIPSPGVGKLAAFLELIGATVSLLDLAADLVSQG
jgi:hypothetical protein